MIGQERLLNKKFSQFVLLLGPEGSLKEQLINEKYKRNKLFIAENRVDGVREVIRDARQLNKERIYVFYNGDEMTYQAQNALLKIAEEPPNEYTNIIIVGVQENAFLDTIISRAQVLKMDKYTKEQLKEFAETERFLKYYDQPGLLKEVNGEIIDFVKDIINNIDKVATGNVFNIAKKIEEEIDNFALISKPLKYYCRYDSDIVELISEFEYYNRQKKFNFVLEEFVLKLRDLIESSQYKELIKQEVV